MFRRFVPRTAVTAVGAQFAFASRRSSSSSAKAPSVSDIKASNKQAALAALSSDIGSDAKQSFDYSGAKKKDLHMPSPSTVNPETISTKSAYSQSLGFNSSIDDNADGKLNKDVSGTEFDRKVYGKSVKSSGSNDKAASKSSGAASHTGPQVATKTKDEEQKMDYEGAMRPATAGQMHSDKKVETNYDIHKKAQHNNQAAASSKVALSDAPINKDANEDKHDYNAHNLPPTPLQELGSAISNMAGRLFHSKDRSSKDQSDSKSSGAASHTGPQVATKTRDEEQKMDWEGAMRPATAGQMHSDTKVETNYDIHKKAQHEHSSQRISSSSGESQQSSLKSNNNNASRNTESPTFTVYGNYTPQAASHEAYATSSMGTSHETADSYNKKLRNASENDKHPTTIQEISSKAANATGLSNLTDGVSSVTGGFFTRGSDAYPQYAGAQIQPTAYHAGKPLHTEPQDANPLVGDSSSEGKSAHSANADNFNLSSLKKEAPTDYSSPDYLVRRT